MIVRHFLLSVNETNCYVVVCEKTGDAVLIDPGALDPAVATCIASQDVHLTGIFITHDHYDHTGALADTIARHKVPVFAGSPLVAGCKARTLGPCAVR